MKYLETTTRLEKLHSLIYLEMTGTPEELAYKLNISLASLYNLLNLAKLLGANFYYCRLRRSYIYNCKTDFQLGFITIQD